jgi:hypothetical protein
VLRSSPSILTSLVNCGELEAFRSEVDNLQEERLWREEPPEFGFKCLKKNNAYEYMHVAGLCFEILDPSNPLYMKSVALECSSF